jgi:hypothetical protein
LDGASGRALVERADVPVTSERGVDPAPELERDQQRVAVYTERSGVAPAMLSFVQVAEDIFSML